MTGWSYGRYGSEEQQQEAVALLASTIIDSINKPSQFF